MRHLAFTLIPLLAIGIASCNGYDHNHKLDQASDLSTQKDNAAPAATRAEIESLVLQLRSPNKDPNPKWEPFVGYPEDYDHAADKPVGNAYQKLKSLGKSAFPILIQHLNEKHYSLAFPTSILRGFSVGEVCSMIIESQVDLAGIKYKSRLGVNGKNHAHQGYFSQFHKGKWWEQHKHLSLHEMQIKALRWAIEREQKIGFPEARDKEYYLAPLQKKLDELLKQSLQVEP